MEDNTGNLIGVQRELGDIIINGSRKNRRVSSVDKQYDHQEGFFLNEMITDFEPMALRLSDSWRRCRARPKHESACYSKFKKLVF